MAAPNVFRLGALYPTTASGAPNLILSSSYQLNQDSRGYFVSTLPTASGGQLTTNLDITTDPVSVPGVSKFVGEWLKPQMLAKNDPNSIFNQYWQAILNNGWNIYPNNLLIEALSYLGYRGYGWDQAANNSGYWKQTSSSDKNDPLYTDAKNIENYKPELIWAKTPTSDTVESQYDTNNLLINLAKLNGTFSGDAPLWLPSMLYTYGIQGSGTSYPGPVLMIKPGDTLNLNFNNKIQIAGLNQKQNQDATLIPNSSYGLNGGSTAGGMFSANFHMHGGHVLPSGFGDNVVARYTSGQNWTTKIEIPKDHGQGSYWYHPHYHPAVNVQLYGGLSGFMQVGDPLSKVPAFTDIPRNVAVLKTMQVEVDPATQKVELAAVNGNIQGVYSLAPNRASMFTVNGEYMPTVNFNEGGWQSLTLTNQDNNYYMNIGVRNQQQDGSWNDIPLFIYGEDGHQYPQIRAATNGPLGFLQNAGSNATSYQQAKNLISLPPGKRVDLLLYIPSGQSELVSTYDFKGSDQQTYKINNLRFPLLPSGSQYANLTSTNTDRANPNSGPGPIAKLSVASGVKPLSTNEQNAVIAQANQGIQVQVVTPETPASAYNEAAVPSVNLYAEKPGIRFPWLPSQNTEVWEPIRKRELNYSVLMLVGPKESRDIPTQQALAEYDKQQTSASSYYKTYSMVPQNPTWLGYENPDFVNDHVFPNGPLIIAQLGTMEEWSLKNWNWGGPLVSNGGNNVAHPFHIHVNDYQVKQSDNELPNKDNLEDVTMMNASGYNYTNQSGVLQKLDPLAGTFKAIPEAHDYKSDFYTHGGQPGGLYTTGHTETTIRMLFQDFLGTYVHHCHLLEHEDAGMMQVVTVIENTNSSWLVPAETLPIQGDNLLLRKADSLNEVKLAIRGLPTERLKRAQVGDISDDYVQDIILSFSGDTSNQGAIQIYDGSALKQNGASVVLSTLIPYQSSVLAPWAFNSDFTGDGKRELVTGGYLANQGSNVTLDNFEITGWQKDVKNQSWSAQFRIKPWTTATSTPQGLFSSQLTGFAVGDFNLDNFDDYATAYLQNDTLRIRIIDGAALSLYLQTGQAQGGYIPEVNILSDMTYTSADLIGTESIALTTGFNSYAQSPIENLIVTTASATNGNRALTFQLNAGHFIATGDSSNQNSGHQHGGAGLATSSDVSNQGALPLQLSQRRILPKAITSAGKSSPLTTAATPTFAGTLAQGGLLVGDNIVISQGFSSDGFSTGNASSSDFIGNTTQDLLVSLKGINLVSKDDLTGITTTNLSTTLDGSQSDERLNLAMLAYQAYTNKMVKPSNLAKLAAGVEGGSLSVTQLIAKILSTNAAEVSAYYGGELDDINTTTIVNKAYAALYRRAPSLLERIYWDNAVISGMAKTSLPMAILQTTASTDQARIALLSAATRWSQIQWGTSDVVDGNFGQGFQTAIKTYDSIADKLLNQPKSTSWQLNQQYFDAYRTEVVNQLNGTPLSNTGFF